MFNPNKIQRKLDLANISLVERSPIGESGRPLFSPAFRLIRHSISEVQQANEYLGAVKRPYKDDEIRWIWNEQAICQCDFRYWATRYGYIVDWSGNLVRFSPNLPQEMILDIFSEMEGKEIAILVMILKARQEGVTTLSELILLWISMFRPWNISLVASSRPDKSAEMSKKMEICYQNQPTWLVPSVETYKAGEYIGFDKQNSSIHIRHGAMMSGLGRGSTPTAFHLSEVAEFLNPDEAIDAALLRAAHDNPNLFGVLESTGAGKSGWWYDKWQFSVQNWPIHQSRLCPIFLPWYILRDLYPTSTWLKAHPIEPNWEIPDLVKSHAGRAKDYVCSGNNHIITKALGSNWEMPPEQMWFWWLTRKEYAAEKKLHLFYQELCADDKEAFQSSNSSIFDQELLFELHEKTPIPVGVYGISAPQAEIPVQFQPPERDIDRSRAYIDIKAAWNPIQPPHEYRLYPLLHRGPAPFDPYGKIIMYERPEDGEVYGIGTDTGYGVGEDRSVLEGIRKGSHSRPAGQVFEFACADMNSQNLWPINLALGTYYSTYVNGRRRQARQVIEGAANGENVYLELRKRGWNNFHNWVRTDRKQMIESKANRQLWYTTTWSRPLMMDMLLDAINSGWLKVNSPWLVDEMGDLEMVWEKQKIMAAAGKHDDRIMALGIVLYSLHFLETKHLDTWISRQAQEGRTPETFAKYSPGAQGNIKSDVSPDATSSYNYKVVNPYDWEDAELLEILRESGASILTSKPDGIQ